MSSDLIMCISLLMIVTSFVAMEWRNLPGAIYTYQVQSVLIALLLALYAYSLSNHYLYVWCATVLASKGIIIPWLLRRYVAKVHSEEVPPLLSATPSALL